MIHALADGIAMGASASSTDDQLRWIVFGAILIHKVPTALGLCSVLVGRGLSKADTFQALVLFSLCTPLGAVLVYLGLQVLFSFDGGADGSGDLTGGGTAIRSLGIGATLTFSGGTFLFVAMHALEDAIDDSPESPHPGTFSSEEVGNQSAAKVSKPLTDLSTDASQDLLSHSDHPAGLWMARSDGSTFPTTDQATLSLGSEDEESEAEWNERSIVPEPRRPAWKRTNAPSQSTRIVLVLVGSLIPRSVQLLVGSHHHH